MATFKIPNSQGQVRQNNRSDTFGELVETFSIDLNRKFGKIFPSKKLNVIMDEDGQLNGGIPSTFAIFDDKYWVLTDDNPHYCSLSDDPTDSTNWTEYTAATSAIARDSDLVVFDDLLLISDGVDDIYSINTSLTFSNNWDTGKFTGLTDATQMHVHRGGQETLFVANGNEVKYYNTTGGQYTVSLQSDLTVSCINSGVNAVWVGTESNSDGNAYVYEIYVGEVINVLDASGAVADTTPAARNAYKVEGTKVMSMEVIDNVPYIVTEKGNIQAFNGAGFTTVASFPFANTTEVISKDSVHPKGMKLHNDSIFINIATERRASTQTDYATGNPSGIWEYNRITGQLHHRFAFVTDDIYYGAQEMDWAQSGGIMIIDNEYGLLLAAGKIEGDSAAVFADSGSYYGYFKTKEIETGSVQDSFNKVYAMAKTMASGESVSVKYRKEKKDSVFCDGVPLATNKFNTTDDISAITADSDGTYHWEVVDIHTGHTAQVTDVTKSTGTYTVTVDSSEYSLGVAGRYEFQNWTKISGTYTSEEGEYKDWGGFGVNPWMQFKVTLNGEVEMRRFTVKTDNKNEV